MSRRRRFATVVIALMSLSMLIPTPTVAFPTVSATVIQSGLVIPWDVAFAPTGQMFVSERPGRIRVYRSGGDGRGSPGDHDHQRGARPRRVRGDGHRDPPQLRREPVPVCLRVTQLQRSVAEPGAAIPGARQLDPGIRPLHHPAGHARERHPQRVRRGARPGRQDLDQHGRRQSTGACAGSGSAQRQDPARCAERRDPAGKPEVGRQPAVARVLHRTSQSAGDRIRARDQARVRGRARSRPGRRDQLGPGRPQLWVAMRHGDEQLVQPDDARMPRRHQLLRPARLVQRGSDARDVERRLPEGRQVGHVAGAPGRVDAEGARPSPLQLRAGTNNAETADDDVQRDLGPPAGDGVGARDLSCS